MPTYTAYYAGKVIDELHSPGSPEDAKSYFSKHWASKIADKSGTLTIASNVMNLGSRLHAIEQSKEIP